LGKLDGMAVGAELGVSPGASEDEGWAIIDGGKKSVPGAVPVGKTLNIVELELGSLPGVGTGVASGVCVAIVVPFPNVGTIPKAVPVGEAPPRVELVVTSVTDNGVVTIVGELGGVVAIAVELVVPGGGDGDTRASGVVVGCATEVVGGEGVTTGVVVVSSITEPRRLLSVAMILERRLSKPVLLVVVGAAPLETGVVALAEAAPLTPVGVGVGVGVGSSIKDPRIVARGSGISEVEVAAEVSSVVASAEVALGVSVEAGAADGAGVGVVVGVSVGVGVGDSRTLDSKLLRIGTSPEEIDGVEVVEDAAAAAVDPPVPENVKPDVTLWGLAAGVAVVDVDPDKTPPGPKVIALPAAEDEGNGVSIVVGSALVEVETVGRTTTGGTLPVDAAPPVNGSKRLSMKPWGGVEVAAGELDVVGSAPMIVVWVITTVITASVEEAAEGSRRLANISPVAPALPLEGDESLAKMSDNERFVDEVPITSCEVSCAGAFVIVEFWNLGRLISRGK
jgi:hypothetical protein